MTKNNDLFDILIANLQNIEGFVIKSDDGSEILNPQNLPNIFLRAI